MPLIVVASERFAEHEMPPGHPEASERAEVMDVVAADWRKRGGELVAPRAATREQLARVHSDEHLRRMGETAGRSLALDPDTYTSPETYDVALLAAGAGIEIVERVLGGKEQRALALVRPPGHHAERGRAMGFCLFNNIAVAAAHARAQGVGRVAIVDYDVHHGNGTQHMFEADPTVLYVSLHQYPFYPGTGAAGEIGQGAGAGFTVNAPIEVGATDDDYRIVFTELVVPVLRQFKPNLILVSAGFDAHERDPLAGMRLTSPAFGAMTTELRRVAEECCDGRIAAIVEGGYDLRALAESMRAAIDALDGSSGPARWPQAPTPSARGRASVSAARKTLASYWKLDPS
jgi:acetoin utilization deacetylase AcuC-like enzyme